jgi:hypothetical protein
MKPARIDAKSSENNGSEQQSLSDTLVAEINILQHELRRVRDDLERAGGSSHELEKSAQRLSNNIELCESDLAKQHDQNARDSAQVDLFQDEHQNDE